MIVNYVETLLASTFGSVPRQITSLFLRRIEISVFRMIRTQASARKTDFYMP